MAMTENDLKARIKEGDCGLYVLYGAESYLTEQYARMIARQTVEEDFAVFNLQRFDGQTATPEELAQAVEALPMMAEKKCVLVRDADAGGADGDRLLAMLDNLSPYCVLVFWQMTVQPDKRKGWTAFLQRAEQLGCVVNFERKTAADAAKLLVSGAKRRGCVLSAEDARYMVEQAGNDLQLLLGELDKLAALADGGEITRRLIDAAGTKNLEARVFDLSKAILQGKTEQAYDLLNRLFMLREEPVAVLGVLSNAYADLYRAKIAVAGGQTAESLAADFKNYKGKEFRLRNAARDAARLRVETLRDCLEILADADASLKFGRGQERILLEQSVTRLICRARED